MQKKIYAQAGEELYTEVLDNGLTVYYLPKPDYNRTFGLFTTNFGSLDTSFTPMGENQTQTFPEGIAHFLEHKLFEKKDGDVMYQFGALGAQTNAFTSFTRTSYLFATQDNIYPCVELLLNFVQDPYFTDENVEKEQSIIDQEIQMYQDDSDWRLYSGLLAHLYPDSPLASDIAGTVKSIKAITAEALYKNYYTFYHPSNMNLFVTGPFDVEEMSEFVKANQAKKKFESSDETKRQPVEASQPHTKAHLEFDVASPKLALGFRGEDQLSENARELVEYKLSIQFLLDLIFGKTSQRYEDLYNSGIIDDSFGYGFDLDRQFHYVYLTGDTDQPEKLAQLLKEALKNYKIDEELNEAHLELIKRENIGEYYKSLNSLEYIANQFSSNLYKELNFFDLPELLSTLTIEKIKKHTEKFIKEMQEVEYTLVPKQNNNEQK